MEALESFVALALQDDGLVVSEAVKFRVTRQTAKAAYVETQTHGFEVDLVWASGNLLVLATVKSFLGSRGVVADQVMGLAVEPRANRLYAMINNPIVRAAVLDGASRHYGYSPDQVEFRLYVGKFAGGKSGEHERQIREWCTAQVIGRGPMKVFGLVEVARAARRVAASKTYRDNPALVAIKVLEAAPMLTPCRRMTSDNTGARTTAAAIGSASGVSATKRRPSQSRLPIPYGRASAGTKLLDRPHHVLSSMTWAAQLIPPGLTYADIGI